MRTALLTWFARHARPMPWRNTQDPYAIWLSETMLQQTQVATVTPYYNRFYARFPTVAALAAADLQEVLTLWAGLGYYRRAKHLHAAAQKIVADHAGQLPPTHAQLLDLPGVGNYTAAAVASIAFGQAVGVLDGNVVRVLARLTADPADFSKNSEKQRLQTLMNALVCPQSPGDFNQSAMELGATVCTPAAPACGKCPISLFCKAFQQGRPADFPTKKKAAATPVIRRLAVVLRRGSGAAAEVLLFQRPGGVLWEHMWEFPALDLDPAQWSLLPAAGPTQKTVFDPANAPPSEKTSPISARKRKNSGQNVLSEFNWLTHFADVVREQLGLRVELAPWIGSQGHQLTHRTMDYRVLTGHLKRSAGEVDPRLPRCERGGYVAFRWERMDALTARRASVPISRLTEKIAAAAGGVERGEGSARFDR